MSIEIEKLTNIVEAALLAFGQPLSVDRLMSLFSEEEQVSRQDIREALQRLQQSCEGNGIELVEVGSGFRYQARTDYAKWVAKLWEEKPPRYSRALLETLVLVAYRQPITRAEIEDIRGVSVSSHIMKTLQERDWVRVVGHKDVPGKPALYATTKAFLDYFNLKSLDELPSLMEIRDLDKISAEIDKQNQEISSEQVEASADAQEFMDEVDVERLLPDGDADHGEGIEEVIDQGDTAGGEESPIETIVAETEFAESAEDLSVATQSPNEKDDTEHEQAHLVATDEDTIDLVEADSSAQSVEGDNTALDEESSVVDFIEHEQEQTAETVAPEFANDDSILDVQNTDDAEDQNDAVVAHNDFAETDTVQSDVAEGEYNEIEPIETANVEADDAPEHTEEVRFSTANYGLRATGQDEAARNESEYAEDEVDDQNNRLSAAEPNS